MRWLSLLIGLSSVLGCTGTPDPIIDGFDFDLNLNLAGDTELLDDIDLLEIAVFSPDAGPLYYSWEWFDAGSALQMEDVPRGEGIVFEVRGLSGGEEIAHGESDPVTLPDQTEVWVLFHRHGALLEVDQDTPYPRLGHKVVAVDGGVVVIGGETGDGFAPISKLTRSEQAGFQLVDVAEAPETAGFAAARIRSGAREGQILIAGGAERFTGFEQLSESLEMHDAFYIWDPASETYSVQDGLLANPRYLGAATALGDAGGAGRVVLTGGAQEWDFLQSSLNLNVAVETLDPATAETDTRSIGEIHWLHSAVAWGPDITVACGGFGSEAGGAVLEDCCDTYSAVEDTWTDNDDVLQHARAGLAAVVLPDDSGDRILVIGGTSEEVAGIPDIDDTGAALDVAEIIESTSGTLQSTQLVSMVHPRVYPFAAWLPDQEKVLVCGGHDGTILRQDCEFFDPSTDTFSIAEGLELPQGVDLLQGAVLDDGSVLMVGGHAGNYDAADFAVLYLP